MSVPWTFAIDNRRSLGTAVPAWKSGGFLVCIWYMVLNKHTTTNQRVRSRTTRRVLTSSRNLQQHKAPTKKGNQKILMLA